MLMYIQYSMESWWQEVRTKALNREAIALPGLQRRGAAEFTEARPRNKAIAQEKILKPMLRTSHRLLLT